MTEDNFAKTTNELRYSQETARQLDSVLLGDTTQTNCKNFCKISPTEETSAADQDKLDAVTTCCICNETYRDPTILPCTHTFCLTCLQHIGTHIEKKPGDPMPCPVCREEFTIPDDGFAAIKRNMFMVRLIEIASTQQGASSVCDKHEGENIFLYCSECNEALCLVCLRERHQNHRLSDLSKAAEILRSQLQSNVSAVKQCLSDALKKKEELLQKKYAVLETMQGFETEVYQVRRDLKALIDQHADSLLRNLDFLRKEQIEDIETEEKELDNHLNCLKNFEIYCTELAARDRLDGLFCKMASELKEQVVELKLGNKSVLERQIRSCDVRFTKTIPSLSDVFTTKNMIGVIKAKIDYSGKPKLSTTIRTCDTTVDTVIYISGMAVSSHEVFIAYEKEPAFSVYDLQTRKCSTQITLKDHVRRLDLKHCAYVGGNVYIVNGSTEEIIRIDRNRDVMKWSTKNDWGRISVSTESTIVAACFDKNALREYSLQGSLLQEIKLFKSIVHPLHAIKLRSGHFVVSHGSFKDAINRVCIVNSDGAITKSFGGKRGSSIRQVDVPNCLAVDEDENILVLDRNNSRVLLLSPALEFRRVLLTKADGLRRPVAMHLDEKTNLLYIADNNWESCPNCDTKVLVFKVK